MTPKEFDTFVLLNIEPLYSKDKIKSLAEGSFFLLKKLVPLIAKEKIDAPFLSKKIPQVLKGEWARCLALPFATSSIFHAYRNLLTENQRKVWDYLIINGFASAVNIKKELGIFTVISAYSTVKEEFQFLPHIKPDSYSWYEKDENHLLFRINFELHSIGRSYYANINEVLKGLKLLKEVPSEIKTQYVVSFEQNILSDFSRLQIYYQQGNISTTAKGLINQVGLGKLQKTIALKEFFPVSMDKHAKLMRTHLLASLIVNFPKNGLKKNTEDTIKALFEDTLKKKYPYINEFLYFYKNIAKINLASSLSNRTHYYTFFKENLKKEWQSVENLFHQFTVDVSEYNPIIDVPEATYYDKEKRKHTEIVNEYNIRSTVHIPLFNGYLFLFAAYGLVEIAYKEINLNNWLINAYSFYDGLEYVRLTNLGGYVFGNLPKYYPTNEVSKNVFILSETHLTIMVQEEESPQVTQMLLGEFCEKTSTKRYYTDFQTFLKGCKSQMELQNKIKMFKTILDKKIPKIWADFFEELLKKINPAKLLPDCLVYQIPKENVTLIQLISNDKDLRDCIMRAEEFCIIVQRSKLNAFRKRLQEFGYLLLE